MPRDIPTYTECAPPGVARSHQLLGGIAGLIINGIINQTLLTVGALLAVLIGLIILANPVAWVAFAAVIVAEAERAKDWYYNGRLLCIRDRDCAIGTVISEPTASFDGDRKLNLLLAPYTQADWVETTIDHIETNRGMLNTPATWSEPAFYQTALFPPSAQDLATHFGVLRGYVKAVRSKHPSDGDAESTIFRQLQIGIVDRVLADPARNFYRRYFRKDPAHIPPGTPLDDAIPEDFDPTVDWDQANARSARTHLNPYLQRTDTLNPMFRYEPERLVPYLHCEIDGYAVAVLIDNAIMAFLAFIALAIALSFLGPFGVGIALALAGFLFALKSLIDFLTGNDGDADPPDVDDPDAPGATTTIRVGDVALTYGNWIMDTEHHNFLEIHPVRAYYLIARNSFDQLVLLENGELLNEEFGRENFDVTEITAARENEICRMVTGGEEGEDGGGPILLRAPQALSMGMAAQYAGGHAATRDD
jgi:hypothetical protein